MEQRHVEHLRLVLELVNLFQPSTRTSPTLGGGGVVMALMELDHIYHHTAFVRSAAASWASIALYHHTDWFRVDISSIYGSEPPFPS